jgi:hypothetical protein
MQRLTFAILALAAAAAAQDIYIPLGFANIGGPPNDNAAVARAKDNNLDGVIDATEVVAFATVLPTNSATGALFMTDGRMVVENGEPSFFFTDSEDGQVVRCVDANHNGVIEPNEANVFFRFGFSSAGAGLFAPDALGVYRDPTTNRTRAYVALDNSTASSLGYTRGIHRLVDLNDDGDAMDAGEQSLFVSGSMGLTVPGLAGSVTIVRDFWSQVRVLPGGKVVAWASGAAVNGVLIPGSNPPAYTYTVQPDMNCWYGFTDNNGVAAPEVWFNPSSLNGLAMHPDFDDPRGPTIATYPNWDIQVTGQPAQRRCFARFMDVVPAGGPAGEPIYYLSSSYNTQGTGDINLNGQPISGLTYRVVDSNFNQSIDAGELSLWCNISGQTYAAVPPVTFNSSQSGNPIANIIDRPWGFAASGDNIASFLYQNGGVYQACVSMQDVDNSGIVDQGEVTMPFYTPRGGSGYLPPFDQQLGPYLDDFLTVANGVMPGPFLAGLSVTGDGCYSPASGMKPVMDSWRGVPQVGNLAFEVGAIRAPALAPVFALVDFSLAAVPLPLNPLGLPAGCFGYLQSPLTVGLLVSDLRGTSRLNAPLPNNAAFLGVTFAFQFAIYDTLLTTPVPFVTTNALQLVIQP